MKSILYALVLMSTSLNAQVWSPDGTQIAFFYLHEIEDIYLVKPDGTEFQVLDGHKARDFAPQWSPDGEKVAFTSIRDTKHVIYEIGIEDKAPRRITSTEFNCEDPSYSPDGSSMVFTSDQSGNNEIYVLNLKSGKAKQITDTQEHETTARWSPDGNEILFRRSKDAHGVSNLYKRTLNSGKEEQITNSANGAFHQSWSPDMKSIAYVSVVDGQFQLIVHELDSGIKQVVVELENYQVFYPGWSPDGKQIAFTRDHSESLNPDYPALMVVDLKGNERMITNRNSFHEP